MIILRPYQNEAIEAVHNYICTKPGNPCVSTPTGSGKSVMMAALIKKWHDEYPSVRGCILAHRKELVQQNYEKLTATGIDLPVGIYSAGLGRRDSDANIVFASIDSVFKKSGDFTPFDFIFVDEAHRIPFSGEGKYRTFLSGCQRFNPKLKVVGWTATPWRMAGGALCHPDHILTEICYEAKITDLIRDGYLCQLRSKVGVSKADLSNVRKLSGGDYVTKSLAEATNLDAVVQSAVAEAVCIAKQHNRGAAVFYCVDIEHCKKVSAELAKYGINAPCLTGKTPPAARDQIIRDFRVGNINAICNVNVLTEGFDAPRIDCIVLLRPTLSAGLFSQMVGRGLRLDQNKSYCLVLDFAGCIDEHGPVDLLGGSPTVMATCANCRESFSRSIKVCPSCGWIIPPKEMDRMEIAEREKRMHGTKASQKEILSNKPETLKVDAVYVSRHKKDGSPDSVCVQFRSGVRMFRHWLCLDHSGDPGIMAKKWYCRFFPTEIHKKITVDSVLGDLFISEKLLESIHTVTVLKRGKYYEIVGYNQPLT